MRMFTAGFGAFCGFAALAAVTVGLAACGQNSAVAAPGGGPKAAGIEAACEASVLAKTPDAARALVEDFRPVPWREYSAGVRRAVFERMAGEKLGRMKVVADQTLTGGESATGGTDGANSAGVD